MTDLPATAKQKSRRPEYPRAVGFWLVAAITTALLAASSAPTPLYPVYQGEFGFSPITLTIIFAVYVFALLLSLLTVGRLSDFVGRLPVLIFALIVDAAAMAIFLGADDVGWLVLARIVQGFATGAGVGVVSAYLLDLQPEGGTRLGSLVAGAAPPLGLGIGVIVTGTLVEYAPLPTRLVFAILTGLFLLLAILAVALPETVRRAPGALAALLPRVEVPQRIRRPFATAVPTMVSTWALGGLILSVGGSLLNMVFGQTNHAVVGVVLGLFSISGSLAAVATRRQSPETMTRFGTAALVVGTGLFIVALATTALPFFVVASIIAGVGFGSGFLGALRSVSQLAKPRERAALLSAIYVVSYLAFSIPALVAGLFIGQVGLQNTSLGYAIFVAVIATGSLIFDLISARRIRISRKRSS